VFNLLVEDKISKTSFEYSTILEKNSDKSFGIKLQEKAKEDFDYPFGYSLLQFIYTTLKFIVLFSFAVALFNFLPIIMLDGGQMFPIIINEFIPYNTHYKKRKIIINTIFISVIVFFLILIAINVLPFFF
jgi:membrane-associated protease RseP (regulator of RpoE activity)